MTASAMAEHQRLQGGNLSKPTRHSNDSGHGTEGNTESVRSNSVSAVTEESPIRLEEGRKAFDEDDDVFEDVLMELDRTFRSQKLYGRKIASIFASRAWMVFLVWYNIVDRIILPLGFISLCTGIATYMRFFVSLHLPAPGYRMGNADNPTGRQRDIQWARALDQGRYILLDGYLYPWALVGQLWRAGMGEYHEILSCPLVTRH
jgi:hypothetical protein